MKKVTMKKEIFVVGHKSFVAPKEKIHIPIQVGYANHLGYVRDNIGDNISEKNQSFCELTALYWIWKNSNADIVGLEHYRRYFVENSIWHKKGKIITENQLESIMKSYDIIIPEKFYLYHDTIIQHYDRNYHIEDYEKCRDIIKKRFPTYLDCFEEVSDNHWFYICNMLIARKYIFDNYCQWLFDILFELERQVDISEYDKYNKRVFGFVSERLFTVWILKNKNLRIKEMPIWNTEKNFLKDEILNKLKGIVINKKHKKR